MGMPVVVVASGGFPITEVANGLGTPIEVASNGLGKPVTFVPSGGMPVVTVGGGAPAPVAGGVVQNFVLGTTTSSTIPYSFEAPATGTAPFTYRVEHRPSAGGTWIVDAASTSALSGTVTGLDPSTSYSVRITPLNAAGDGTSTSKSKTTAAPAAAVPAQMAAPALSPGANSISVDRAADPSDGGSAITGFDLRHSPEGSTWTTVAMTTDPQTVSGLTNGTTYQVQTRANNAVGNGAWSTSATATPAAAATAPAQMSAPALTASSGAISVDRAADPANGGSAITGFDLRYSTDQATWTVVAMTTDPQSITGLTNGTLYYVQTRAKNAIGDGAYSVSATATPSAGAATFNDDFTGDGSLTGRTGWTFVSGTTGGATTSAGQLNMGTSTESVWQSQDLAFANQWVEGKLVNVGANGPFLALRLTDINNWVGVRNSATVYAVFKRVANVLTQLSSASPVPALNDIMRLEASGTLTTLYINGVVVSTAQNLSISDVPSTTRQGVIARTAIRSPWIDDYKTGTL